MNFLYSVIQSSKIYVKENTHKLRKAVDKTQHWQVSKTAIANFLLPEWEKSDM